MPVRAISFSVYAGEMEKSKVRRCLFGRPDHESLRKDLDEQLKATKTHMKSTWNFDSDLDKPLDGRFEWTLLKQEDDVPSYYLKGYRPTKFRRRIMDVSVRSNISSQTPFTPVSRVTELDVSDSSDLQRENETTPELRSTQRQSRMDEHFPKVKSAKRRLSISSPSSSSEDSDDDRPRKFSRVKTE